MTEETAKALTEAINRLAAVAERLVGNNSLMPGIQVWHYGAPSYPSPQAFPGTTWGPGPKWGEVHNTQISIGPCGQTHS
jgi:hypothetical protein